MTVPALEAPTPAYPAPVHVRRVQADPHAARRLAHGYRAAAESADSAARRARSALRAVEWTGQGAQSRWAPADALCSDLKQIAEGLRETAESLERFASSLEKAHEHHRWSLKKLAVLGAVVVVTAVAVTVTMGAAAVAVGTAEAALAESALAGAGAAVAAASAAEASAAASLLSSAGLMTGLRVLGNFVLPKLAAAEIVGGASALQQEAFVGEISTSRVLLDMQLGLFGSAAAGAGLRAVRTAELTGLARLAAPHLVVGGAMAGTSALDQWESTGSVSASRTTRDGVLGAWLSGVGYGIARNGALSRVAPARLREISARWRWANPQSLERHLDDHGALMGIHDAETYAKRAHEMWLRAESGELRKGKNFTHGSIVVFDEETSVFAAYWPNGLARTMFIPTNGGLVSRDYARSYWLRNVDAWL